MSAIQEHASDLATPVPLPDPVAELFAGWGLRPGRVVCGWTCDAVERSEEGDAAFAVFSRENEELRVRFKRAGSDARFTRVGGIDIAHDEVDPRFNREVGELLKRLAIWLKRSGDGHLVPLLEPVAVKPREVESAPAPQPASPLPPRNDAQAEHHLTDPPPPEGQPAQQPYVVVHEAPPLDPAKKAPADKPVLGFEFIDVADLVRYPDALREIYNGTRGGLVVRGVYSKEEMQQVVARLETRQKDFPQMLLPATQKSYFLGLCLEGGDPTLSAYLDAAERFREEIKDIYAGMEPFEQRVERLFASLSGGRDVELARFYDGRPYTPATIRILPEGGQLAPHCGNEMLNRPSYEHLHSIVDEHDQISYFLTLQEPEEGGGLIIYSLKWTEVGADHILPDGRSNVGSLLGESEWMEVRPQAGDVLMFDGGRYLHRVDWIKGAKTRWTMGGFLMFDKSGKRIFYWA